MNKKKIIVLAMSLSLVAILAIGGTIAYFTDTDSKDNTFTVGNVDIILTEPKWDEAGSKDAPEVYPGEALAKDPTITNDGKNPCFVRVKVTGLDSLAPAGEIIYRTDYVDNKLGDNWVLHTDGYYYHTKVLEIGQATDALFDQIVMPKGLTNGYTGTYTVNVAAQAVQAQGANNLNWAGVQAMSVEQIATWFTTCGMK